MSYFEQRLTWAKVTTIHDIIMTREMLERIENGVPIGARTDILKWEHIING